MVPRFGGAQRRRRRQAGSTASFSGPCDSTSSSTTSRDGHDVDAPQLSSSQLVLSAPDTPWNGLNTCTATTTTGNRHASTYTTSSDDNDNDEECPNNDNEESYGEGEEDLDSEEGGALLVGTHMVYPRRRLLPAPIRAAAGGASRKSGTTDVAMPSTSLKRPTLGGRKSSHSKMKHTSRKHPTSGGGTTGITTASTCTVLEFIFKFFPISTSTINTDNSSTGRRRKRLLFFGITTTTTTILISCMVLLVLLLVVATTVVLLHYGNNRLRPPTAVLVQVSNASTNTTTTRILEHNEKLPIEPTSGKPYRSLTYHDIPFQFYSNTTTSCDDAIDTKDISFTLVTQVSEDRLWMITQHCQRWAPGPISAAVYTNKTLTELWTIFHDHEITYGKCQPNQLTLSVISPPTSTSPNHHQHQSHDYPVNTLRNLALSKVQTSHIMYADSDFFVSTNLYQVLHGQFIKQQLASDSKLALVVPAFQIGQICKHIPTLPQGVDPLTQPECREDNLPRMPKDIDALTQMLLKHRASAFDPTNRGGHGSTSYKEWFQMTEGDLWDLPCILSNRYEPYVATRFCKEYPPYQPAFTGYGKNKMTQVMHMRHVGYVFSQVGGVFVVHYPHPYAPSRETWNSGIDLRRIWLYNHTLLNQMMTMGGKSSSSSSTDAVITIDWTRFKRGQVDKIFLEFKKWLHAQVPESVRTPMCPDAFNDDVKLWLNKEDAPPNQREMLLHPRKEPVA